jgi:hypothetical protein
MKARVSSSLAAIEGVVDAGDVARVGFDGKMAR